MLHILTIKFTALERRGRQSIEWRGHINYDDRVEFNKSHHHVFETEYSWTHYWQSELEFHVSDKEETSLDWEKTEFQNQIQIYLIIIILLEQSIFHTILCI